MVRALYIADGGAHTGFAQVTHAVTDRLVDRGHDVHILAANYRGDHWPAKAKLYPANLGGAVPGDHVGLNRILEMLGRLVPDVVVIQHDPAVVLTLLLDNRFDPDKILWSGGLFGDPPVLYRPPVIAYMPIDGYDSPGSWDLLRSRVRRVSMSQFGLTAMPEAAVAQLAVDTTIYKPMNKTQAKRKLGYDPDRFLVLRVDRNQMRKDYPATWKALRPLMRKYSDIDVHFHCLPRTSDGYDLRAFMFNDTDIRNRANFSPDIDSFTGWSDEMLATLYAAADVYVTNSWSEGFGLGPLSALACGTPVVATDCSAITEVVGPGGILVPPSRRITSPMGQDHCLSDIDGFTAAIQKLYLSKGLRRSLAAAGIKHAAQFSWDRTADVIEAEMRKALEARVPTPDVRELVAAG